MSQSNKKVVENMKGHLERLKFGKKLTSNQTEKIKNLIKQKMVAFQWSDDDVGRTNLIEHEINTGNSKPIRQKNLKYHKLYKQC